MTPPPARIQPAAIRGKTVRTKEGHVWDVELHHLCWVIAADQQVADEPIGRILAQHVVPFLTVDSVELQYLAVQEQDAAVTAASKEVSRLSREIDEQRTKMNTLQMQQQVERTTLQVRLDDRREAWLKAQRDSLKTWLANVTAAERAESTASGLERALRQEEASFRDLETAHATLDREVQALLSLDVVRSAIDGEPVSLPSLDPAYAQLGAAIAKLLGVAPPRGTDLAGRAVPVHDAYAAAWAAELAPRGWRSLVEDLAHLDLSQLSGDFANFPANLSCTKEEEEKMKRLSHVANIIREANIMKNGLQTEKDANVIREANGLKTEKDVELGGDRPLALDALDLAVPQPVEWAQRFRPRAADAPAWQALARWVNAVRACVAAKMRSPRADKVWVGPVGEAEAEFAKAQKELVAAADARAARQNNGGPRPVPVGVGGIGGPVGGPQPLNAPGARAGLGLLGGPRPLGVPGVAQPAPQGPGVAPVPMPIRPVGMPGYPGGNAAPPATDASWLLQTEKSEPPATVRARRELATSALTAWLTVEATPADRDASSRAARRAARSWAALQRDLATAEAVLGTEVERLQALDLDQLPALDAVADVEVEEPEQCQTIQQLALEPRFRVPLRDPALGPYPVPVQPVQSVAHFTPDELRAKIFVKHGSLLRALEQRSELNFPDRDPSQCASRMSFEEFLLFIPKVLGEAVPSEKLIAFWKSLVPDRAAAALITVAAPPTRGATIPVSQFCCSNLRGVRGSLASRHGVTPPAADAAAKATDPAKARKVLQRAVCALLRVTPVEPGAPGPHGPGGPIMPIGQPQRPTRKVKDYSAAWNAEVRPRGWHGLVELLAPRYAEFPAAVQLAMLLRAQPDLLAKLHDLRTLSAADWHALQREGVAWHGLGRWLCAAHEYLRLLKRRADAHDRWEGALAAGRRKLERTRTVLAQAEPAQRGGA